MPASIMESAVADVIVIRRKHHLRRFRIRVIAAELAYKGTISKRHRSLQSGVACFFVLGIPDSRSSALFVPSSARALGQGWAWCPYGARQGFHTCGNTSWQNRARPLQRGDRDAQAPAKRPLPVQARL